MFVVRYGGSVAFAAKTTEPSRPTSNANPPSKRPRRRIPGVRSVTFRVSTSRAKRRAHSSVSSQWSQ